jgi:hypothetical protein
MKRTDRGDRLNDLTTPDASDWHLHDMGKMARGQGV